MDAYLLEWANLLLRWAHVVVAVAWIGASFYFIWLDNHLEPSQRPELAGELWAIHGGGFYRAEKYRLGPAQLPATLHWFKWEAYWTWLTGFALLSLMYYGQAELYLIDPSVMALSKPAAIGLGLGTLVVSLAVYEGLCRSPAGRSELVLGTILFVLLALTAWGLTKVFSGRGAFIHYGAILGTIMAANVAHIIIPGQRRMVEAVKAGREPDPRDGWMGKQRSVHNTYFTLPAVFAMISNHYATAYGQRWSWALLIAMTLAGALIRVWFVMRHKGRASAWVWLAGLGFIGLAALLGAPQARVSSAPVPAGEAEKIVASRCVACHSDRPTFQGIAEAPKGVKLDTPERMRGLRPQIYQQAVASRAMPPGNLTAMTEEERTILGRWASPAAAGR